MGYRAFGWRNFRLRLRGVRLRNTHRRIPASASRQEIHHVPEGGKIIQGQVIGRRYVEVLLQFSKELRFFDTVDPQISFEVGIEFDDFLGIAGLLDDEVDQERFQLGGA